VSVIHAPTNTVIATILVGDEPLGVAVTPDGSKVYVGNFNANSVSVINTTTNTVRFVVEAECTFWHV
jgi:YVTN family beta-propeller protein